MCLFRIVWFFGITISWDVAWIGHFSVSVIRNYDQSKLKIGKFIQAYGSRGRVCNGGGSMAAGDQSRKLRDHTYEVQKLN